MDETIIREAELDILILENDLSGIYDESGSSSKKCKRDVNIYRYDFSVFVAWKKNVTSFFSRVTIIVNKSFLGKLIQFLVEYKKYKYIYYIYIKYLASYFGLRTRELKKKKIKEILEIIY